LQLIKEMTLSGYPNSTGIPSRDAILQALTIVGQQADGSPLDLDQINGLDDLLLLGYLEALMSDLAERAVDNTHSRQKIVAGRRIYVESGRMPGDMDQFFTARVKSLGANMQSWLSLHSRG
jgi:hypothetical protein